MRPRPTRLLLSTWSSLLFSPTAVHGVKSLHYLGGSHWEVLRSVTQHTLMPANSNTQKHTNIICPVCSWFFCLFSHADVLYIGIISWKYWDPVWISFSSGLYELQIYQTNTTPVAQGIMQMVSFLQIQWHCGKRMKGKQVQEEEK